MPHKMLMMALGLLFACSRMLEHYAARRTAEWALIGRDAEFFTVYSIPHMTHPLQTGLVEVAACQHAHRRSAIVAVACLGLAWAGQSAVPLVLLLSVLLLSARYRWHQYLAVLAAMGTAHFRSHEFSCSLACCRRRVHNTRCIGGTAVTLVPNLDGNNFSVTLPWEFVRGSRSLRGTPPSLKRVLRVVLVHSCFFLPSLACRCTSLVNNGLSSCVARCYIS